ncbi:MAG: protein-tyrosine-phosphatase, partial [Alphaproteobacteria bacterium]|nr:protein-tyrosine-phosphatase [Alphaproteobacteria bacterium]
MIQVRTPALRRSVCGLDELEILGGRGVTHVLSIMDPGWGTPAAFERYPAHRRVELRFHDAIEADDGVILPTRGDVERVLAFGAAHADIRDAHVLVHCHAGVSRSTAGMTTLIVQAHPDVDDDAVFERVLAIRPQAWPNLRMVGFADELLGRG